MFATGWDTFLNVCWCAGSLKLTIAPPQAQHFQLSVSEGADFMYMPECQLAMQIGIDGRLITCQMAVSEAWRALSGVPAKILFCEWSRLQAGSLAVDILMMIIGL